MALKDSLSRTLFRIAFAAIALNGLAFGTISIFRSIQRSQNVDLRTPIKAIVQTGPLKEALKTAYLAELMDLSVDQPVLTCDFDTKEGRNRLLASPVIKEAQVQIHEPGTLYVDYVIRQPVALLADYTNIAIDAEGYPFPLTPFFSPKKLPEIYLRLKEDIQFNRPIQGEQKDLAFEIIHLVKRALVCDLFNILRIDVSNAFEMSYGRREIVLTIEDIYLCSQNDREVCFRFPRLLRLSRKNYSQDLGNYLKLREELLEKERQALLFPEEGVSEVVFQQKIIDLRIPQLAFIDEGED